MKTIENAWRKFIRPQRLQYNEFDLGPDSFTISNQIYPKQELDINNNQNKLLKASFFDAHSNGAIIYCHGFNGCRVEAIKYATYAAALSISFCCFDFQAAGNSEGDYITFGHLEQDDIQSVITYLMQHFHIEKFVLWGRSLGATTICFHQIKYTTATPVVGIILDSPFYELNKLAIKMIQRQLSLPKFVIKSILLLIKKQVLSHANFDMSTIKLPLDDLKLTVPSLFMYSKEDTIISFKHSERLLQSYKGPKKLIQLKGDHNEVRGDDTLKAIAQWSISQLKPFLKLTIQIKTQKQSQIEKKENSTPPLKTQEVKQKIVFKRLNQKIADVPEEKVILNMSELLSRVSENSQKQYQTEPRLSQPLGGQIKQKIFQQEIISDCSRRKNLSDLPEEIKQRSPSQSKNVQLLVDKYKYLLDRQKQPYEVKSYSEKAFVIQKYQKNLKDPKESTNTSTRQSVPGNCQSSNPAKQLKNTLQEQLKGNFSHIIMAQN